MIRTATKKDIPAYAYLLMTIFKDMELPLLQTWGEASVFQYLCQACTKEGYRYFYQRVRLLEEEGKIIGVAVGYPATEEKDIDQGWVQVLEEEKIPFEPLFWESECEGKDWYIDSVSVDTAWRGKGIGTRLLEDQIEVAREKGYATVALNVDFQNPRARKLYESIGFICHKEKEISNHPYAYMHFYTED